LFLGGVLGGRAPDWLEIARWKKTSGFLIKTPIIPVRQSLIPHRTLTHLLPLWLVPLMVSVWYMIRSDSPTPLMIGSFGFFLTGFLHVFADLMTPVGIPILVPWKRVSLGWVHGIQQEGIFIGLLLGLACLNWAIFKF
jgi:membrane-bound metal-dependent hydrolase YbcI (DUF457 family)